MIDFGIAVILTVGVSVLTIVADWVASKLVLYTRAFGYLREIINAGDKAYTAISRLNRARAEIERHDTLESCLIAWGTELAAVALSIDFVGLGIWIRRPNFFPFFERFNEPGVSRETPVWLIIIILHILMLFVSLVLKHNHVDAIVRIVPRRRVSFPRRIWFVQNRWMIATGGTGFIALLASIVVFTNAL